MHSTHSYDGKMSLRELKRFFMERGISFACMTEHTDQMQKEDADAFVRECHALSNESFVFVPGFEVPYKNAHVLHIGSTEFICDFADATQLQQWRAVSEFVVLAHPVRNKFMVDETLLACIDGVEVWNQQYEGKSLPRMKSIKLLKKLRTKKQLLATGGLDLHRKEHFGTPTVSIDMPQLSEEDILETLTKGEYTFGTESVRLAAHIPWKGNLKQKCASRVSIIIITSGKLVNKILFNFGISLPSGLKQLIRSRM